MKNKSILILTRVLIALALAFGFSARGATVLQSFDELFIGDDQGGSFEFNLVCDPAVPTTVRFAGFLENQNVDAEGAARFFLGWQTNSGVGNDEVTIASIVFPPWPDYLYGVRLPATDAVSGQCGCQSNFRRKSVSLRAGLSWPLKDLRVMTIFVSLAT